ncbi:hypothetical protein EC9_30900 [Rosistilla ulvae]|uniref:Sulfotransferase domain protein n=2 Tax=Rosistilla ulvae TaxID=1930277 RepID=A0A517M1Y9_9BACT|nr:hypothetical protein EC9_30900 [Rosistilla ulvae]
MYWETAAGHIWRYNPGMKWIVILRHPIYRARSAWAMNCCRTVEQLSLNQALATDVRRSQDTLPYQNLMYSYVDRSYYANQIRRLIRVFGRSQLHFLTMREFRVRHNESLRQCFEFLGVDSSLTYEARTVREGIYENALDRIIYEEWLDRFRWDIEETAQLTGKDLSAWLALDYLEESSDV